MKFYNIVEDIDVDSDYYDVMKRTIEQIGKEMEQGEILNVVSTKTDYYATAIFNGPSICDELTSIEPAYMVVEVDKDSNIVPTTGWYMVRADSMELAAEMLNEDNSLYARNQKLLMFELNPEVEVYEAVVSLKKID